MESKQTFNYLEILVREGKEEEVIEIAPGINMELDSLGKLIGVEIFRASNRFKDVIKLMKKRLQAA